MVSEKDQIFVERRSVTEINRFEICVFFINYDIVCHLKLEISLSIPSLNE